VKSRTGFVSNSSTSSFVVVGLRLTEKQIEKFHEEDDDGLLYLEGDGYIKGKALVRCDENMGIEDTEYTLAQLTKVFEKVAEENGVDVSKLKLFMGTSGC